MTQFLPQEYLQNLEILTDGWYSLWTQHTLFYSMLFFPAMVATYAAYLWRLEHLGHNWNLIMASPVLALLTHAFVFALFVFCGKVSQQLNIDDFGMERGTEYALEQIYNIVDSRYRSRKPLIVTTNLTLDEIRYPQDTAHARIYDRLLEMCIPISCIGVSFRKEAAQEKLERMKLLIG